MKRMRFGVFILLWGLCSSVANAQNTLVIPEMKSDQDRFIRTDLPAPTSVKSSYVSMVVQKGWSISSVGPNEKFKANVTATPTSDVTNDPTYIGLNVKKEPPQQTLEQFYETKWKPKLKPGDKQSFVTWQGKKWLLWEYSCQNMAKEDAKCWAGKSIANGQEVVMIASVPIRLLSKFESQLVVAMQSITFSPPTK